MRMPMRVRLWKFGVPDQVVECVNVSQGGVYFATGSSFQEGQRLEMLVMMPGEVAGEPSNWHCEGRVLRVEGISSGSRVVGVAVRFYRRKVLQSMGLSRDEGRQAIERYNERHREAKLAI